jgi:glucosamine-6-phosphate isomerase
MKVSVLKDYQDMSKAAAEKITELVNENPNALVCFAAGSTPIGTFEVLADLAADKKVDFGSCKFVGLDEWVDLDKHDSGSCQETLYKTLFHPLKVKEENICFFDAKAKDLQQECQRVDKYIRDHGNIDLMLLGIGVNGHLGFNEPGVSFNCLSHVVDLDENTKAVGQKYFETERELSKGITLGTQHIMDSNTVILIANGANKAEAVNRMINGEVTNELPATILQTHRDCYVYLEERALKR